MAISTQRFFLLITGLLFCVLGCARDPGGISMLDDHSAPVETHDTVDVEVSFEQNILPILTAKCALSGCHVANGPEGLDFRTYESFVAGGEHGPVFVPGNAEESEVVEEIAEGKMPPEGPPLPADEIQLFRDWINQQEKQDDAVGHDDTHDDDENEDDGDHDDDDENEDDGDHDDDDENEDDGDHDDDDENEDDGDHDDDDEDEDNDDDEDDE